MDQPARRVAYGSLNSECRCLKLVDTFRFGLFRSVRAIDAPMEITVYPKALPLEVAPNQGALGACRELAPSKQESTTYEPSLVCKLLILGCRPLIPDRLLVGDATGFSRPSFSGEVRSSREFQQSDDLRHIHWRNSARSGQLMVKEFDQTPRGGGSENGAQSGSEPWLGSGDNAGVRYKDRGKPGALLLQRGTTISNVAGGCRSRPHNLAQRIGAHLARIRAEPHRQLVNHSATEAPMGSQS